MPLALLTIGVPLLEAAQPVAAPDAADTSGMLWLGVIVVVSLLLLVVLIARIAARKKAGGK